MHLEDRDLAYLVDMLSCCNDIIEFTSNVTFEAFERDRMRRLATERQLETLGEAANHVSSSTQNALEAIAWTKIVALRNKLAHDYGEILAQRVWQISKRSIPDLQEQLLTISEVSSQSEANPQNPK